MLLTCSTGQRAIIVTGISAVSSQESRIRQRELRVLRAGVFWDFFQGGSGNQFLAFKTLTVVK